jgi:hypothetical protein
MVRRRVRRPNVKLYGWRRHASQLAEAHRGGGVHVHLPKYFVPPSLNSVCFNSCILIFLDKEYILISRRYQLHPASATTHCSSGTADAHSQTKKEELQKRKVLT